MGTQMSIKPKHQNFHLIYIALMSFGLAIGAFVLLSNPNIFSFEADHWLFLLLESSLLLSFLVPIGLRLREKKLDPFEPPIIFGFYHVVYLGLYGLKAMFLDPESLTPYPSLIGHFEWLNKALGLYLLGWITLWGGYKSGIAGKMVKKWRFIKGGMPQKPKRSLITWGLILYSIGVATRLFLIHLGLYGALKAQNWDIFTQYIAYLQILRLFEGFASYGVTILLIAFFFERKRGLGLILAVMICSELLFALISSYRTPIVQLFILLGSVTFYVRRRLPWRWILIGALVVVLSDPFLSVYRTSLYDAEISAESGSNPLHGMVKVFKDVFSSGNTLGVGRGGIEGLEKRVSYYLPAMALAVWHADTYGPLEDPLFFLLRYFTVFIPRIFWAEKPTGELGFKFYTLIEGGQGRTASSPMLPGWLYLEWGVLGLIGYFFFLGIFQSVVYSTYSRTRDISRLIFIPTFVWILSHFDMAEPFGWLHSFVYQLILLLILRRFLFKPVATHRLQEN